MSPVAKVVCPVPPSVSSTGVSRSKVTVLPAAVVDSRVPPTRFNIFAAGVADPESASYWTATEGEDVADNAPPCHI